MTTAEGAGPGTASSTRRQEIVDVATRLFQQRGFEGTPVTIIARELNMTAANLYWYFPSKQHLLKAVLLEMYRSTYAALIAVDDPARAATHRLRTFVSTLVQFQLEGESVEETRFSYIALQTSLDEEAAREIVEWQRQHRRMLSGIVEQGVEEGNFSVPEVTVAVSMILTASEYVFLWFRRDGRLDRDEIAGVYAELAMRVVGATDSGSPGHAGVKSRERRAAAHRKE